MTRAARRCTSSRTPTRAFYIADGAMTFQFEDCEVVAGTGTFVFVPRGVVHTARDTGGRPMRGLLSPGDAEHIPQPVENP